MRRVRTLAMAAALASQCGVLLAFVGTTTGLALVGVVGVGALLGVAASVDLDEERIPNRLLVAAAGVVAAVTAMSGGAVLADVVLGAALAFVPIAVVLLTRGIGMGDLKMAGVLGAAGGLVHPLVGLATVFLMAVSTAVVGLTTRWKRLALGPWLWGSFLLASSVAAIMLRAEVRP
jgi:leader peptidase (prepilin peptidase)/N-methyltransferase